MVRLISNAKQWHRFWSIRLAALGAFILSAVDIAPHALASVWALLPVAVQQAMPDGFLKYLGLGLVVAAMVARVIKQEGLRDERKDTTR